jgi:hypothetical protein
VLVVGGFTAVPRWTLDPVAGVAGHEVIERKVGSSILP